MTPEEKRLIVMYKLRISRFQRSADYNLKRGNWQRWYYWQDKIEATEVTIRAIEAGIYASVTGGAK